LPRLEISVHQAERHDRVAVTPRRNAQPSTNSYRTTESAIGRKPPPPGKLDARLREDPERLVNLDVNARAVAGLVPGDHAADVVKDAGRRPRRRPLRK
jgi:hypothetical protein